MEKPSALGRFGKVAVLTVIVILVLYPFASVLATSFATEADIVNGGGLVLIPLHPTLAAYKTILQGGVIAHAVVVSIFITLVGTAISLVATTAMAYGLSRPIIGRRALVLISISTLFFFPGIIPLYLMVKQLGLLNNYASLILPVAVSAFNMIVMRQFFMDIPQELIDSARIDGAGEIRTLFKIILPLSKAIIAVIALFYGVFYWNQFFFALLFLNDSSQWPLQTVLYLYVLQRAPLAGAVNYVAGEVPPPLQSIQMAVVVIATVPILLVYPFLQKYFTKGVLTGAIKG
ncbi:MAG: carbohydrate ABC transporter permease [Chloroflexota bacterium]|nr:carbohydrate ABC transporter permease [Chloroflexota bacterium]